MAHDLDDSELYWTRKQKGLVTEAETERYIRSLEKAIQSDKEKIKELEEKLTDEQELNEIIKNTKIDKIFFSSIRNGKTVELAMNLRKEILNLPECKLYGIKNCKNKVILLTKDEVIPKSLVREKIEEYKKLLLSCNRFSDVDRIKAINERILMLQELLGEEK